MSDKQRPILIDPLKVDPKLKRQVKAMVSASHWSKKVYGDPVKDDFRVFLSLMWRHLGLPAPTELQLSIAHYLQHHGWTSEIDRLVVMAFRGAAKSWITAAFVLWNIHRDPQLKIGVVSGSGKRAVNFVSFCLRIIDEWPLLQYLTPGPKQRQSSTGFDVSLSLADQTPSIWSAGITSQIVGYRADIIVGDDVETNTNSMTQDMRSKVSEGIKEFDSIIKPGGQIIFLGTPQTEASVYNELPDRGFTIRIWPARFPTGKQERVYGDKLAPWVVWKLEHDPSLRGKPTEPTRFSDEDLASRELSITKAVFQLQFMLDTSLADVEKYPLRLRDLIVASLDQRMAPDTISWGNGDHLIWRDLRPISLNGDLLHKPGAVAESHSKYQAIFGFIDPSGKGKDETTLTVGGILHSTPFVLKQAGWQDGFGDSTLEAIAALVVRYKVQKLRIEEDFGSGMFGKLLQPFIQRAWDKAKKEDMSPALGSTWATEVLQETSKRVQKELRILEVLEPLFQAHRLVIDKSVFEEDFFQVQRREGSEFSAQYSLMWQITRLSRERGCLAHDDRVEGLAGLCAMFQEFMGLDPSKAAGSAAEDRLEQMLQELDDAEEATQRRSTGSMDKKWMRGNLRTGRDRL